MKHVLAKFGAYANHIASLIEDKSTIAADKAKLKGYYKKWTDARYFLGRAVLFCRLINTFLSACKMMK